MVASSPRSSPQAGAGCCDTSGVTTLCRSSPQAGGWGVLIPFIAGQWSLRRASRREARRRDVSIPFIAGQWSLRNVDERVLVEALRRALPALPPERARRIENQLEALARLRSRADDLRKGLAATNDREIADRIRQELGKAITEADAIVERLRNAVGGDPLLHGVKLALAWQVPVSAKKKAEEEKK